MVDPKYIPPVNATALYNDEIRINIEMREIKKNKVLLKLKNTKSTQTTIKWMAIISATPELTITTMVCTMECSRRRQRLFFAKTTMSIDVKSSRLQRRKSMLDKPIGL